MLCVKSRRLQNHFGHIAINSAEISRNWLITCYAQKENPKLRLLKILKTLFIFSAAQLAWGSEFTYEDIAKRYNGSSLSRQQVDAARMQGECLVGLKELNFKKKERFDPVAEWTNYRSASLLEQYSPCKVLIIMEVAQAKLKATDSK